MNAVIALNVDEAFRVLASRARCQIERHAGARARVSFAGGLFGYRIGIDLRTVAVIEAMTRRAVEDFVGGMLIRPSGIAAVLLDHLE